jgi:hypothetical protein
MSDVLDSSHSSVPPNSWRFGTPARLSEPRRPNPVVNRLHRAR